MQSHDDMQHFPNGTDAKFKRLKDIEETRLLNRLEQKAVEMVKNKDSEITAGKLGEEILWEHTENNITLRRLPDDDLALRVSIGSVNIERRTDYFVFRGDPKRVYNLLKRATNALLRTHPDLKGD